MFLLLLTFCLTVSLSFISDGTPFAYSEDIDDTVSVKITEEPLDDFNNFSVNTSFGVSIENPEMGITPYGTSRPTKVWNITTKGQYNFTGTSTSQTMYTNYKFKGKNSYKVYIKNHGNYPLAVKAKRLTKTYASTKISGGKSATIEFSNFQKDTEFYVTFDDSYQDFLCYVK